MRRYLIIVRLHIFKFFEEYLINNAQHFGTNNKLQTINDKLPYWIMYGNQFGAIGESGFDLNIMDHFRNAFHNIITG